MMDTLKKLAPFLRRAKVVEVGQERLLQIRNKLAYILITTDISENSKRKILSSFACPVYQCLTMEEVAQVFNFMGTKVVGFHRSPLSQSVLSDLREFLVPRDLKEPSSHSSSTE